MRSARRKPSEVRQRQAPPIAAKEVNMENSSRPTIECGFTAHQEELVKTLRALISEATRHIGATVSALDGRINTLNDSVIEIATLEARIIDHFRRELSTKVTEAETRIINNLRSEISWVQTAETRLIDHFQREFADRLRTAETNITDKLDAKLDTGETNITDKLGKMLDTTETKLDGQFQTQLDDGLKSLQKNLIVSLAPRQFTTAPIIDQIKQKQNELAELIDVQKQAEDEANNEKDRTIRERWEAIATRVGQLADVARTELEALIY
jgi:hypothetical protein